MITGLKGALNKYADKFNSIHLWNMYCEHACIGDRLLDENDYEGAIEQYENSFRIRQSLKDKHQLNFFHPFKNPFTTVAIGDKRDKQELERIYHWLLNIAGINDRHSGKHLIKLISWNYLVHNDARSFRYLEKYSRLRDKSLEHGIILAMLSDALGKENLADDAYFEVYSRLKQDFSVKYEILPTIKGKVYTMESMKLLRNMFLFKESSDVEALSFEKTCSDLIRARLDDEPKLFVPRVRRPLHYSDVYINVIKRERCRKLSEVIGCNDDALKEAAKCNALIHLRVNLPGMDKFFFEDLVVKSRHDAYNKAELIRNKKPIDNALVNMPVALHKDSHPDNYGIKEDGSLVIFDCENKGMRHVTSDLAKLCILGMLDNSRTAMVLGKYAESYNLNLKAAKLRNEDYAKNLVEVHSMELPFLVSSIELAFLYPSAMPEDMAKIDDVKKNLFVSGLASIGRIKDIYRQHYTKHEIEYKNLEGLLRRLTG